MRELSRTKPIPLPYPTTRAPVPFQITDQRWAEMAQCLLSCINRAIPPEQIQRFHRNPERTPITDCANRARTGQHGDGSIDCCVHLGVRHDLVSDQATLPTVALQPPLCLDQLPS